MKALVLLVVMTGLARADIARWHAAARKLAHDGNCAQVEVIGNGVRVEDARYYAEQFVVDPSLAPCFAPPPPPVQRDSYRSTLIAADVLALSGAGLLGVAAAATHDSDLTGVAVVASIAAFFLTGPIVHLVEDNPRNAAISLGIRAALPLGGALLGAVLGAGNNGNGEGGFGTAFVGAVAGLGLGAISAYGLDWGLLPYVDHTSTATTVGIAMAF